MLNTKTYTYTLTDITINRYGLWSMEGDRRGDVISCISGSLWITQQNDLKDYVLDAGQKFWITKPGTVVVQALENSKFSYSLNDLPTQIENNTQPIRVSSRAH
jgi:hypothetical protein